MKSELLSLVVAQSIFMQSVCFASDPGGRTAPIAPVEKPKSIFHVALAPWEAKKIGLDTYQDELLSRNQAIKATDGLAGTVMFLTTSAAAVYYVMNHAYKHVPMYVPIDSNPLISQRDASNLADAA